MLLPARSRDRRGDRAAAAIAAWIVAFAAASVVVRWGASEAIAGAALATVVIGGLVTSTLLTLLVVPTVYARLFRNGTSAGAREGADDGIGAESHPSAAAANWPK